MKAEVTGIEKANAALNAELRKVGKLSERFVTKSLISISANTAPMVPIDTSFLLNSEYRKVEKRGEDSDLGGTMRLGAQLCLLKDGSKAREIYGAPEITERHRHRYEVNNTLLSKLEEKGLVVSGRAPGTDLCEVVELPADVHPWFVACQFHPEFTSNPRQGHPLFSSYVKAALANKQGKH